MSLHLRTPEYTCKNCKTSFIAYSKGLGCPKCNQPEDSLSSYGFVDDQVWVMMRHKRKYKRFRPDAWHTGCYSDQVQTMIFSIFDYLHKHPEASLEEKSKGIVMFDSDGKEFVNDKYHYDLLSSIDKKLKIKLEEKRIINRLKKFFNL